ncbi:MAG: type II secretion system F family protein [Phycisphaeraceae bacterium]|nr:type II secretion system F family protein [Phycisphaerales bacterium]MCB9842501.1 type II secretion system F family protein [Phycisphaeraceae bacterium]
MSVFRYTASEAASGRVTRGELAADSAAQVRAALRRMGLAPLRVHELRRKQNSEAPALKAAIARLARSRRRSRLVEFYENLAALIESGTPLAESIDLLSGAQKGSAAALSTVCRTLAEDIRGGRSLAGAMADHGDWFGPIDLALVRSAEESGQLPRILADLAEHHGRSDELRGRLAGALAYPILLLVFGAGVVVFLTTKTLPQLAGVLVDGGVELPRATAMLLAFGSAIARHWPWLAAALFCLVPVLIYALRRPALARMRLRVPLLGPAMMRSQVGSASLLIARLLDSGLPLTEALALTAPTIPNAALRDAFASLGEELTQGGSISAHLKETSLFEPVFLRVLEVGEARGDLSQALQRIGARYRSSAARLIDRLAAALEPAAILVLAVMIGFVVYAAIIPMTRLGSAL